MALTLCAFGCAPVDVSAEQSVALPLANASPSNESAVVAVRAARAASQQLCTGVALLPNLVLTARHCITAEVAAALSESCENAQLPFPDEQTRITVTADEDIDRAEPEATFAVTEVWLPEAQGSLCGQDLALLLLGQKLKGSTVELTTSTLAKGTTFKAVGYGLHEGDYGVQRSTSEAKVDCVGGECSDSRIAPNELRAQSGACEGDSGGPALDSNGRIFALASRSTGDCTTTAYLGFAPHLAWLKEAVQEAAELAQVEAPAWASAQTPTPSSPSAQPASTKPKATKPINKFRASGGACTQSQAGLSEVNARAHNALYVALFAILSFRRKPRAS